MSNAWMGVIVVALLLWILSPDVDKAIKPEIEKTNGLLRIVLTGIETIFGVPTDGLLIFLKILFWGGLVIGTTMF